MKLAILSPVAWRTPPRHYGPWEQVAYNIAEGAVANGIDVTLFATGDSFCSGKTLSVCPQGYEENKQVDPKVAECMHISFLMEQAEKYDLIHNNFDFLPLTYSRLINTPMITTIHGFSSPRIVPVYKRYNDIVKYVSISNADRNSQLEYIGTIYNGIDKKDFTFESEAEDYLLFFGRIHHDKGAYEAIQIAIKAKKQLLIAGIIQDKEYFKEKVEPYIDGEQIIYAGEAGPEKRNRLLRNACVLLHPINFAEPFGLSVAEAMFCGTPTIAFNKGSMPELIEDSVTGFLTANINEAADRIADVPNIQRRDCRRRAELLFSLEKMADEYHQVYKKILSK